MNSEPECWNCRHFVRGEHDNICTVHSVILPTKKGPHLICTAWEHTSDAAHAITWWRRRYLRDDTILYRYVIYSSEIPQPLARFCTLERASQASC
jgi:hypothetical protein